MNNRQLPLFKELMPYGGKIDENNRWIKMADLVPWDVMAVIYAQYFDSKKLGLVKKNRLILGLLIGQVLLNMSDREIVAYFHENPYFQYFCGYDHFVPKMGNKTVIHNSLLSKRRKRLGKEYVQAFEREVLAVLKKSELVTGEQLMLDATVVPSNITYPNDIKLLNTARDWCCQTVLIVKNAINPSQKIRTYRKTARKLYLTYQKTKKKTHTFIRKTKKKMCNYLKRNLNQLESLLQQAQHTMTHIGKPLALETITRFQAYLKTAHMIYTQQHEMLTTKGRRVKDRIVSFHQPLVRPIVRGKDAKKVEFGPKLHVALSDGFAFLDVIDFKAFNEGVRLTQSLEKHHQRFKKLPNLVLADQLYATRDNRKLLEDNAITHTFKPLGRPPSEPDVLYQLAAKNRRKNQRLRNHIEGAIGTIKTSVKLDKIVWTVPDGHLMQSMLALTSRNLQLALAKSQG